MNRQFKLTGPYGTYSVKKVCGQFLVRQNLPFFRSRPIQIFSSEAIAQFEVKFAANFGVIR